MLSSQIAETEILAAIGWLAREGKVKSQKKQRKDVKPLNFSLWQINKNGVSHILTHPIFIFLNILDSVKETDLHLIHFEERHK